jgi:hypothetical protein
VPSRGSERKGQRRGEALFRRRPDVIKTSVSGPAATSGNVHSCDAVGKADIKRANYDGAGALVRLYDLVD